MGAVISWIQDRDSTVDVILLHHSLIITQRTISFLAYQCFKLPEYGAFSSVCTVQYKVLAGLKVNLLFSTASFNLVDHGQ